MRKQWKHLHELHFRIEYAVYIIRRDGGTLTEWIKTRIQEIEKAKTDNIIPNGETSGLCKYQIRCFEDGNGLTDKPLSVPKVKEEI